MIGGLIPAWLSVEAAMHQLIRAARGALSFTLLCGSLAWSAAMQPRPVAAAVAAASPGSVSAVAAAPTAAAAAAAPISGVAASGPTSGVAAASTSGAAAPTAARHPFTAVDLHSMQRILDPRPSPSGDRIAFTVRSSNFQDNRGETDVWIVRAGGGGGQRLTSDGASSDARWAPDGGTLYFLTAHSGTSELWRLRLPAAGAPRAAERVLALPLDIANPLISPDGARIVFSLDVFPDCPTVACTAERLAARDKSKVKARLYPDGFGFIRHWDVWEDGRRSHLFTARLDGRGDGQGHEAPALVELTRGMVADIPSKPFGGTEELAFSPDGGRLVFAARQGGRQEPLSTHFDLYEVPADGSQPPHDLTPGNTAWANYPAFSPDGKTLAYAATTRPGFEADRFHVVLRDLASGRERLLAGGWDRSAGPLLFSADGRTLLTTADDVGQTLLFAVDVATGQVRKLVGSGHVESPALAGGRVIFSRDHLRSPVELFGVRLDGGGLEQITHLNDERLAAVLMGEPEQLSFAGAGGDPVYAWVVKPAQFDPGRRYPLAFLIHGGPQGSFSNHFHYRWNPQPFAGAGYAVVMIDFHGSTGYGQAFTDAISGDWGGKPLADLQLGLAAALARYPWIDGERACALGASYGGFMTNWIAGNWPDRFRCLVTHDGTFDQRMMYYDTEELWFPEWELGGPYYERADSYEKWNPARFVDRWRTPMLVIHGALDFRIPDSQGLGAFAALQRRGIPSQLLYFPNENHWVLKPADGVLWHQTVLDWLGHWLRGEPLHASPVDVAAGR
jgi:dipeptidyl aminopeptidase/acylaminoacyl peptidase